MRVLFLGTPDFAIPSLRALASSSHEIVGVITQPDKEGNRRVLTPPPVKEEALRLGLKVFQFASLRREGVSLVRSLAPDVMVTAAFGQILSEELLGIPPFGTLNVHGSLLPKYRGSSPIQSALLAGDKITGVTIMRTVFEVDAGDVLLKKEVPIDDFDTAGTLFDKIAQVGAEAIVEALSLVESGRAVFVPQDASQATFCKMISKSDAKIERTDGAAAALLKIRAYSPWPVAYIVAGGERIKIFSASIAEKNGAAGTFYLSDGFPVLNLESGAIRLLEIQREGKKRMSGRDYIIGHSSLLAEEIE